MRLRALPVFLLALVMALAAVVIAQLLSALSDDLTRAGITIEQRGDLHLYFGTPMFWSGLVGQMIVPFHSFQRALFHLPSMLPVILLSLGLSIVWQRRGRHDHAVAGMLCLAFALVPWFAGRYMLSSITEPSAAGPTPRFMLASVFWSALVSALMSARQLWAPGRVVAVDEAPTATPLPV